jgi:hypothetical protein
MKADVPVVTVAFYERQAAINTCASQNKLWVVLGQSQQVILLFNNSFIGVRLIQYKESLKIHKHIDIIHLCETPKPA